MKQKAPLFPSEEIYPIVQGVGKEGTYSMKRNVMDFSFPEDEVQTRVGQCLPPPTPLHQIPPPHPLPHARKSLDDVLLNFTTSSQSFTHWQVDLSRERLL